MPPHDRRSTDRSPRRRERMIRDEPDRDGPSNSPDQFAGRPGGLAAEGSPGTNPSMPYAGPLRRRDDPPDRAYYGSGSSHDAPSDHDGDRHAAGAGAGSRGREGLAGEGEATWGEIEQARGSKETSGRHPARGPQAARRSDRSIHQEIHEQLARHSEIDASDLEILVEGGEVTLQGRVGDRSTRWLVEDVVEAVSGVSLVHNQLRVAPG